MQRMKWTAMAALAVMVLSTAASAGEKTVLLVHSYHTGYPWVDAITKGVKSGLEGSGAKLEIFYMDTKRKTSDEWKKESGELALKKVEELKPVVVITADDNAQTFFAQKLAGKKGAPQVVFCGVNAEARKYGFPADNVTGILERPHFTQCIEMLREIVPDIKSIAVISDDGPTSTAMFEYMKTQDAPVKVASFDQPATMDEWKKTIEGYQDSVDAVAIAMYHTVKKEKGGDSLPIRK